MKDSVLCRKQDPSDSVQLKDLANACLWSGKQMSAFEWFVPGPLVQDHHTGQGKAFPTYAYGCVIAEIEVDMRTGYVDVKKVTASHDVGTAINPALIRGQIYGGIAGLRFGSTGKPCSAEKLPEEGARLQAQFQL